jgi:dipeptidyl aminopeptidase/acylaminoacyl peptidase
MIRKTVLGLLFVVIGLSLNFGPALAQEDPNKVLAEGAARSFLISLINPTLHSTLDFYLSDAAQLDPVLAELRQTPPTGYKLVEGAAWLDPSSYQAPALLQPGNRRLLITVRQHASVWQVDNLQFETAPPPAPAAITPAGPLNDLPGQLVFQTSSGGDIYFINANGTGLRYLTQGIDPELSPDGRRVAFTRWGGGGLGEVYVLDLATGQEQAVLTETQQPKSPTWSPDGQSIIISYQRGLRIESSERMCDDFKAGEKSYLRPLGGRIVFDKVHIGQTGFSICYIVLPNVQWGLRRIDLASGTFEDLPADLYSYGPSWHPTNPDEWIYKGERSLILQNRYNPQPQFIGQDFQDHTPVISPDGTRLVISYRQHDHWEVHTMNLDGTNRQRLTETPLTIIARQETIEQKDIMGAMRFVPKENQHWNNAGPTWSPDGSQIAFMTDRTGRWEIWLMNADGSNQRPMFGPGVLDHLTFEYAGVDEQMLSWRMISP